MNSHLKTDHFVILGIGSFGVRTVSSLIAQMPENTQIYGIDSDRGSLVRYIQIAGRRLEVETPETRGLGAGGSRLIGRKALSDYSDQIRLIVKDADSVFLFSGLGGGIGSGGMPVVAELCRSLGKSVISMITMPASFEGKRVKKNAVEGLSELLPHSDLTYVILTEYCGGPGELGISDRLNNSSTAAAAIAESICEYIMETNNICPLECEDISTPHIIKVVEDTENDGFVLSASGYKSVFMKYGSCCFHSVSVMNH